MRKRLSIRAADVRSSARDSSSCVRRRASPSDQLEEEIGWGEGKLSSKIGAKGRRGVEFEGGAGEEDEEERLAPRFRLSGETIVSRYGSAIDALAVSSEEKVAMSKLRWNGVG